MTKSPNDDPDGFRKIPDVAAEEAAAASADEKSTLESQQIGSGKPAVELAEDARKAEHNRNEEFRNHFSRITTCALYIMATGVTVFAIVWAWHLLAPCSWRWLVDDDIEGIQNIVTGGVLAGLIADQFRKRMGKNSY